MTAQSIPLSRIPKRGEVPSATLFVQSINSPLFNLTVRTVNFALALVPARVPSVKGLGAYSFAMAWPLILGAAAGLDVNRLLVRLMIWNLLATGISFKHAGANTTTLAFPKP